MNRSVFAIVAATALVYGSHRSTAQQPAFRAGVDVVLVPVSVTRGRTPVAGLTPADFVLLDRGVPQQVDAVLPAADGIDVTFVGGAVLESQADQLDRARSTSEQFRALLGPDDRLRVVGVGERVTERPMRPAGEAAGFGPKLRTRGVSLADALVFALMWPIDPDRRHLVVAYTGGLESWSTLRPEMVPAIAARSDAVLHAVVTGPPPDESTRRGLDRFQSDVGLGLGWCCGGVPPALARQWRATYDAIDDAVRTTGGRLHHLSAGVDAFERILADFRSSYVLRYTPRGVEKPGWHDIAVRLVRPGSYTIRARKGYEGRP